MEYRKLGNSGLKVSRLCLGAMMFGDRTDEQESGRIVGAAFDAGVNFIDTADQYAKGESERITGKLIASNRDHWVLATKVGNAMGPGPNQSGLGRKWIMQALDASLKRLGGDYVDIYYLHRDFDDASLEETVVAYGRHHPVGQGALLRTFQLPRLAHRRSHPPVPRHERAATDRLPALLQRDEPPAGSRNPAGLPPLRDRRRALQPARARRAHRQIQAERSATRRQRAPVVATSA